MLFGEDFMSGCRKAGMSPEQVGMYIYMLILEWTDKAPLEDDMKRLAIRCGWDVRIVKRLVAEIVDLAKYTREDGRLSNERMQFEIGVYVAKVRAKEEKKAYTSRPEVRELPDNYATATGQLADSYATANEHLSEKPKENNEASPKNVLYAHARNIQKQTQTHKEEEEKASQQQEDGGVLASLNGAAYPMLESIKGWVTLDDQGARTWLTGTIQHFGEQATKDAFHKLKTDIAEGKLIGRPLQVWSTIARKYAAGPQAPPGRASDSEKKAKLKAQRDLIRAEYGWTEEKTHG